MGIDRTNPETIDPAYRNQIRLKRLGALWVMYWSGWSTSANVYNPYPYPELSTDVSAKRRRRVISNEQPSPPQRQVY